jgi:hypothetical protein
MHVRGALTGSVEFEAIKDVLVQARSLTASARVDRQGRHA